MADELNVTTPATHETPAAAPGAQQTTEVTTPTAEQQTAFQKFMAGLFGGKGQESTPAAAAVETAPTASTTQTPGGTTYTEADLQAKLEAAKSVWATEQEEQARLAKLSPEERAKAEGDAKDKELAALKTQLLQRGLKDTALAALQQTSPPAEKAIPKDEDSFVLSDSADEGRKKRFTWVKLKEALGLVFAALKHGHSIDDVTDLSASLSNKANVAQAFVKCDSATVSALSAFSQFGATLIASAATDLPSGASPYGVCWNNFGENPGYKLQFYADVLNGIIYFRKSDDFGSSWSDWKQLATATPPQEMALPLAAGIDAGAQCYFYKTQEGVVILTIDAKSTLASGPVPIGMLPVGYRPARTILSPIRNGEYLAINADGLVRTHCVSGAELGAAVTLYWMDRRQARAP